MTLIAWQNGPVFRSGAVGTGQACCCKSCPQYPLCCQLFISWPDAFIVDNVGIPQLEKDASGCNTGRIYATGTATFPCSGGGSCTFEWRAYFTATLITQGSCYKFQAGSLVFDDFVVVSTTGCACPGQIANQRTSETFIIYAACS